MKPPRSPDNRRGHSDSTDSAARSVGTSAQTVREEAALAVGGGNRSCRRARSLGGRRSQRRRTDRTNIAHFHHARCRILHDYKVFDNYPGTDHHRVERADTRADHDGRSTSSSCCADHDCRAASAARRCPRADYNGCDAGPACRAGPRARSRQRLLPELQGGQSGWCRAPSSGRPRLQLRPGPRWGRHRLRKVGDPLSIRCRVGWGGGICRCSTAAVLLRGTLRFGRGLGLPGRRRGCGRPGR